MPYFPLNVFMNYNLLLCPFIIFSQFHKNIKEEFSQYKNYDDILYFY